MFTSKMLSIYRSDNTDYKGSGFDRGHLAAAGNHRLSQNQVNQTFILSNMAPQVAFSIQIFRYENM